MSTRLYVGNLPYSSNEEDLRKLFSQAGQAESVSLPTDRYSGQARGFGFVEMATSEDADKAIQMFNGFVLDGRELRVNVAREREQRGGGGGYGGSRSSRTGF